MKILFVKKNKLRNYKNGRGQTHFRESLVIKMTIFSFIMTTPLFKASDSVNFIERFLLTHMICYLQHFDKYEQLLFIDILFPWYLYCQLELKFLLKISPMIKWKHLHQVLA